jgi:hypothetical protein
MNILKWISSQCLRASSLNGLTTDDILAKVPFLRSKFADIRKSDDNSMKKNGLWGNFRHMAIGNIGLNQLSKLINH